MNQTVYISSLALVLFVADAFGHWPQFQGPDRNGISSETGLLRFWPDRGPNVLWTIGVGPGFGGASVRGRKVYLLDREDDQKDILRCISLDSGEELWRESIDAPGRLSHNGSRSTPTVGEKRVFAVGPFGHVYGVDLNTHKLVWSRDMIKEFQSSPPNWGFAQSPLLYRDKVIIAPLSETVGLAALDRKTGKTLWRSEGIGDGSYASPILRRVAGVEGIVFITKGQLSFIDPDTGKLLWSYGGYECRIPIPFATVIGDDRIFVTAGYGAGSVMIKVRKTGDGFGITELFRLKDHGSQIHPALFYEGFLYANFNTNENLSKNPDGLVCLDLDGNMRWQTGGSPNFERGNLIIADGMILILDGSTGHLTLAQASPKGYKELARAKVLDGKGKEIWAPLALSAGRLIVRDQNQMKCLRLKANL